VGNGLKPEWISHDAQVVRNYVADPLVHDRVTPRLARFIVDGGTAVAERADAWSVPTLLLYAAATAAWPGGSAGFAAAAHRRCGGTRVPAAVPRDLQRARAGRCVRRAARLADTLEFPAQESTR